MKSIMMIFACSLYLAVFLTAPSLANEKETLEKKQISETDKLPAPGRDAPIWDKDNNPDKGMTPSIQKIEDGVLRVGSIMVNKKEGSVLVMGQVNMQEGLVEYLACGVSGKLHESVLKLYSEPFHIQLALLLLGLEPGKNHLKRQGDHGIPQGDPIEIWVTWFSYDKKTITHRAEDLLFNKKTGLTMEKTPWIFTGSQIVKGRFMAQVEHSIAATYHDPYAIIDHPLKNGSDDTIYYANKEILPPKGTTIKFLIKLKETK